MVLNKETIYTEDLARKKIKVVREFDAPVEQVWKAWTESKLLDQWWAPKPWKTTTKSMDFREGGRWFYYMEGPDGSRHYCIADYKSIVPNKSYSADDAFCDESGTEIQDFPNMHWEVEFVKNGSATKVNTEITFTSEENMKKIIEMGFKDGFAAAHTNLDELLAG
jgi:uncharacterized protein YndB with AHSA1/START domain